MARPRQGGEGLGLMVVLRATVRSCVPTSRVSPGPPSGAWPAAVESSASPVSSTETRGAEGLTMKCDHDAITYTQRAKRKTVTAVDFVLSSSRDTPTMALAADCSIAVFNCKSSFQGYLSFLLRSYLFRSRIAAEVLFLSSCTSVRHRGLLQSDTRKRAMQ